jgi:hypothetical protein
VNWVLFQVSTAVLLDSFLSASNEIKLAERLKTIQVNELQKQVKNPLDPLLLKLSKDYSNQAGLSAILRDLFKVGHNYALPCSRLTFSKNHGDRCWTAITWEG